MLWGAPRVISISHPFTSPTNTPFLPLLPPPAGRRRRLCLLNVHYKGQNPHCSHLRHVTSGSGVWGLTGLRKTHQRWVLGTWWDELGFVCICFCAFATPVDCQRAETVRTATPPVSLSSHLHRCFGIISKVVALASVGKVERSVMWKFVAALQRYMQGTDL